MNEKELKRQIRRLRKLKLQMKSGSKDRIELHRKIKELKIRLSTARGFNPEKEPLVKEIQKLEPEYERLGINLYKFSIKDLEKHIGIIKRKRGLNG